MVCFHTIKAVFIQSKSKQPKSQRGQNKFSQCALSEHIHYTTITTTIPVTFSRLREYSWNKIDYTFKRHHYGKFLNYFSSNYTNIVKGLVYNWTHLNPPDNFLFLVQLKCTSQSLFLFLSLVKNVQEIFTHWKKSICENSSLESTC